MSTSGSDGRYIPTPGESVKAHGLTQSEIDFCAKQAIEAKDRAYCPYSNFRVGSSILLKDNRSYTGVNVENASYPVGTCAERCALGTAVATGVRYGAIKAMAVATNTPPGKPSSPCGMCRQFMGEFCEPTTPVLLIDEEGTVSFMSMEELLPNSFGPSDLVQSQRTQSRHS